MRHVCAWHNRRALSHWNAREVLSFNIRNVITAPSPRPSPAARIIAAVAETNRLRLLFSLRLARADVVGSALRQFARGFLTHMWGRCPRSGRRGESTSFRQGLRRMWRTSASYFRDAVVMDEEKVSARTRAMVLPKRMTQAEGILWSRLRRKKVWSRSNNCVQTAPSFQDEGSGQSHL